MNTYQMINRDTGKVVYQAEAQGWRQFKLNYIQWAQTKQEGILTLELQEIKRLDEAGLTLCFTHDELRLIGRMTERGSSRAEEKLGNKIKRFLEAQ